MSDSVETVKIKGADDYIIINKSDFDASKHELYDEVKPKAKAKKAAAEQKDDDNA